MGKKTLTEAQIENVEMRTETELELIRTIVEEMHFMIERGELISDKNTNRYIIIVEALEKQITKKPIETPTDDTCLYHENYCPTCEKMLIVKYKHCPSCGQKLDWKTDF